MATAELIGRPARRARRLVIWLLGALAALMLGGFAAFVAVAIRPPVHAHGPADAIVVLTGGSARLSEAGRLLRHGYGRRLLVSGANLLVGREDVERLTGLDKRTYGCCVDVGYAAQDTIGNAGETRAWAGAHGFRRIIVVTASYHMPRSLAELAHAMPDVELVPHPVTPRDLKQGDWWLRLRGARLLAAEYVKLVTASLRIGVSRLASPPAPALAGPRPAPHAMAESP